MAKDNNNICIAGPIATGKSTLIGPLAEHLDAVSFHERNTTNPAYAVSLKNPKRWAFESELTFMIDNLENWSLARNMERPAVLERCPADSVAVFAASRRAHDEISEREYNLLFRCAELAPLLGGVPDLIVLLSCPANIAYERVILRNEEGEESYTEEYLEEISMRYEEWGRNWSASPLIRFDSAVNDIRIPAVVRMLASEIRENLGLLSPA